jgi:hypothetical protein
LAGRQLSRPTDNVFLCFSIEVSLAKREWVEGMKELSDVIDAELDYVLIFGCHGVTNPGRGRSSWPPHPWTGGVKLELFGIRVLR